MFDALPEHVPAWTASTFDSSVGVDFLGTRAANLAMLRQLTGVYNNQVVSARQHAILAWCAWRFVRAAEAAGRSQPSSTEWRQFLEAVETVQLVAQQTAGPELGGVAGGLGSDSRKRIAADSAHIPLRFADYKRTHQTSAMAAVQYGPSARAAGLGFLSVKDGLATVYGRGLRLATALDELLKDAPGLDRLVRLPVPESFPRKLAEELGRRGLCIPGPEHPARPERAPYIDALFGFDGLQSDDHRARTLTLVLEWTRRLGGTDGLTDHELRSQLLGHDLEANPMPELLQPTALRWRLFQVRQLHRYGMESWLGLVERAMAAGRRDVHQLLGDLDETIDGSELAEIWRLPATEAVTRLLPDPAAWTRQDESGPWASVWEDIDGGLKKDGDTARAARAALRLTLASVALTAAWVPKEGELRTFAGTGGRTRICLLTFASWWAARGRFPLRSVMGELLEELVLQQHVGVAVSRFDGRGRRLRFSLGDRGWELLPGTVPTTPTLTSDRLGACMSLLADLGLLKEVGRRGRSVAWRITPAGRSVLGRALTS